MQYADGSVREEGVWVYKNSAWVKVGSDQAGDINYLSNGDAEAGSTTGWSLGNVTLTNKFPSGVPTFGSGAAGTLSFTNSSSSPIAGTRSFVLADSAATTAGNFLASDAFTIDAADLAKVLTIDLSYQVTSGTINASGTSSNSLGIAIYDVTASQWIMPAGVWAITQTSGVGRAVATFQTPITSTSYRLVLFNANATSGAVTLKLDRMSVGPQSVPVGAPVTDWQSYTPIFQGFGTPTNVDFRWRRVGSNVEVLGRFTTGTTTAVEARIGLPSGLSTTSTAPTLSVLPGSSFFPFTSSTGWVNNAQILLEPNVAYVTLASPSTLTLSKITGVGATGTGVVATVAFSVPIQGFSSQVQMSSDTDTRVVSFTGTQSSQAVTANTTNINFTMASDTHAAWSTNVYTVPVSGDYLVSGAIQAPGGTPQVYKNGTAVSNGFWSTCLSTGGKGGGAVLVSGCKSGDTISLRHDASVTVSNGNLSIHRLSGPSVVAATETVAASYYCSTNVSISSGQPPNFDSKEFDTHSAVATGAGTWKFTAPVSGLYELTAEPINTLSSHVGLWYLYKNNSIYRRLGYMNGNAGVLPTRTVPVRLNAGDYIDIRPNFSVTISGGALNTDTASSISIKRVGN